MLLLNIRKFPDIDIFLMNPFEGPHKNPYFVYLNMLYGQALQTPYKTIANKDSKKLNPRS